MKWFVYVAKCNDNSLYTGITTDPKRRGWQHNNGYGAKSILGKRPVKIVYLEEFINRHEANKREFAIKNWRRENKLKLIARS